MPVTTFAWTRGAVAAVLFVIAALAAPVRATECPRPGVHFDLPGEQDDWTIAGSGNLMEFIVLLPPDILIVDATWPNHPDPLFFGIEATFEFVAVGFGITEIAVRSRDLVTGEINVCIAYLSVGSGLVGACALPDGSCVADVPEDYCIDSGGTYLGDDTICPNEQCPPDFDDDGVVDFADLLQLLSFWGPCPGCPEDLDGNGSVGFSDLLLLVSVFGECG